MTNIIDEIEEDVRRDRWAELWKKHGKWLITIVVLLISVIAGREAWNFWQENRLREATVNFENLIPNDVSTKDNQEISSLTSDFENHVADSTPGFVLVGKLTLAGVQDQISEKIALLENISEDGNIPSHYQPLLKILQILAQAEAGKDLPQLADQLLSISKEAHPYRSISKEIAGMLMMVSGNRQAALSIFEELLEFSETAQGTSERAKMFAAILQNSK